MTSTKTKFIAPAIEDLFRSNHPVQTLINSARFTKTQLKEICKVNDIPFTNNADKNLASIRLVFRNFIQNYKGSDGLAGWNFDADLLIYHGVFETYEAYNDYKLSSKFRF